MRLLSTEKLKHSEIIKREISAESHKFLSNYFVASNTKTRKNIKLKCKVSTSSCFDQN